MLLLNCDGILQIMYNQLHSRLICYGYIIKSHVKLFVKFRIITPHLCMQEHVDVSVLCYYKKKITALLITVCCVIRLGPYKNRNAHPCVQNSCEYVLLFYTDLRKYLNLVMDHKQRVCTSYSSSASKGNLC